ncbi:hypothetical protein KO527_07735 [Pseudoalteromonas sp. C2R02]|uniref:hypothetical protein n=1 Tax=Pseudoalteromonas sp. C2R02 TaxID=2841565 RepID=UPI001C098680|nr:hypothetical protein [Pseudoalteromonas sp. C2R02]MBU2969233.1 hypothetical protein [Pseudoalteromonas sp. C2R02]
MDKAQLISQYEAGTIGKQQLGQLRRMVLEPLIEKILSSSVQDACDWLDDKKSKLCTKKIAAAVGYDIKPVNVRQSFKPELVSCQKKLKKRGVIVTDSKTTKEIGDENARDFLEFMDLRLCNKSYRWPINNKGQLYRKAIWAYFLDLPVVDVKNTPEMLSRNEDVKNMLSSVDVKIVEGKVKTLDHSSEAALDEVLNNMTSRSISTLRQQLKEVREKVSFEREEKKRLAEENEELLKKVAFYEQKDKALISGSGVASLKKAGVH